MEKIFTESDEERVKEIMDQIMSDLDSLNYVKRRGDIVNWYEFMDIIRKHLDDIEKIGEDTYEKFAKAVVEREKSKSSNNDNFTF